MILLDAAEVPRRDRLWCHLVSDTSLTELHAFAARVGLPERAFERDHYDVPAEWRDDLLAAGAQPVTTREVVAARSAAGLRRPKRHAPR